MASKALQIHELVEGGLTVRAACDSVKYSPGSYYAWRSTHKKAPLRQKRAYTKRSVTYSAVPLADTDVKDGYIEIKGDPKSVSLFIVGICKGLDTNG